MDVKITFNTDNAAFESEDEIGDVLGNAILYVHAVVHGQTEPPVSIPLRDTNGNTIGSVEVTG